MRIKKIDPETVERFEPDTKNGLNSEQVEVRKKQGLTNKASHAVGKSYTEIILTNVLSFFNILLFVIAGLMIYAGRYNGLFFLFILIPNILIGLYEDIKARVLLSRLRIMTQPKTVVVRNGEQIAVETKEVVLDDMMHFKSEAQITADGIVVEGNLLVNESFLTGESLPVEKKVGDEVYSGSFVVSGNAFVRATKVGRYAYIEKLQHKANKFRRSPSQILRSLRRLFKVLGAIVICLAAVTILIFYLQGKLSTEESFKECIKPLSGSMVAMIPSGLYLLTSVALATAVISLSKKKAQVQDFYSVEMLARTNVLCVDKTGTITDGSMSVKKVVPLAKGANIVDIEQIVSNIIHATNDDNFTAKGLKEYFTYELTLGIETALPFNSDNKYSAATFKGGKTYAIGAIEYLNIANKNGIIKRSEEFTFYGFRVLVVAESKLPIKDGKVQGELEPLALVVMQDHIRPEVKDTFKWFADNNVAIKVISGDNAQTVSEIARQAGVENAEHFVSLAGMSKEEVAKIAPLYTVFGRVTPEQKEIIVQSLKNDGKTVAMTGDGVNDILALKRADCSIAMASGADAARNVSHIVLMDSNFDTLPEVVAEGRRVINNLQRTSSLFLTKTMFAILFTVVFLIASLALQDQAVEYPFSTNNLYLWEILGIGVSAFFIALEKNSEIIKGSFLGNVFKKAIPAAITMALPVAIIYIMFMFQKNGVMYTGVMPDIASDGISFLNTSESAQAMSTICVSVCSLVVLFRVCTPFTTYRKIIFASATTVVVLALVIAGIISYTNGWQSVGLLPYAELSGLNIFDINFLSMNAMNYCEVIVIVLGVSAVYIAGTHIYDIVKSEEVVEQGEKKDVKN